MYSAGLHLKIKEETFDSLKNLWRDHGPELRWQALFVLPAWLETWWETLHPGGDLYLRSLWEHDRLCGIAPLYIKDETAWLLGSEDVCDYLDLPAVAGREALTWSALLEDLSRQGVQKLELGLLRKDSAAYSGLSSLLQESQNLEASWEEKDVTFEMDLYPDWEAYLKALSKKQRHEIRRKLRKIHAAADAHFRELQGAEITPAWLQTFFDLFVRSREDKAAFLTPAREQFFDLMIERMSREGVLRLGLLELDAKPAGMTLHFVHNGRVYLYNSGHDPDYRSISAGLMTKIFLVQRSIEQQRQVFDFLKGREIFKHRLGGKEVPLYKCTVTLISSPGCAQGKIYPGG